MRTAQSRVWLGQKQSRGYQLYGMGGGGAQSHRDSSSNIFEITFSQMAWGSALTLPAYQVLVDTLELMSLARGQAVLMSASRCRCAGRRGSARRASQNSWKKYSSRQPTAAAPLQPITVSHRGDTPCEFQTRVRA